MDSGCGASGEERARRTEGTGWRQGHLKRMGTSQTEGNGRLWEGLSGDGEGDRLTEDRGKREGDGEGGRKWASEHE